MERLPFDLCYDIFSRLDHQNLATAQKVCRKWRALASENALWSNLFKERWGTDKAKFFAPIYPKSWKDAYVTQDRCDRVGLGLKIIREGEDYYLVHQGEIRRHLGSKDPETRVFGSSDSRKADGNEEIRDEQQPSSLLNKIIFFIGDLESASANAKRSRLL